MSLKVCIVSPVMNKFGGGNLSLLTVIDYLIDHGVDVKLIYPEECDYTDELLERGIEFKSIPFEKWVLLPWEEGDHLKQKSIRLFKSAIEISRQIERWECDVVYTNTSVVNVGALAAMILNIPHVWHLRESIASQSKFVSMYGYDESAKFICDFSNSIIFNSKSLKSEYKEWLREGQSEVIYNFVEVNLPQLKDTVGNKKVDIVVPFYNDKSTIRCLESVKRHWDDVINRVMIVSDCGPDEELIQEVEKYASENKGFEFHSTDENGGYVHACNYGMINSNNDVVILTTDTIVTEGWVRKLIQVAYQSDEIASVTPLSNGIGVFSVPVADYNPDPDPDLTAKILRELSPEEYIEVFTMHGFCSLIKRNIIEEVGIYDREKYKFGYGEENDLSMRIRKAGYKCVLACKSYVYHEGGKSFGNDRKRKLIEKNSKILKNDYPEYQSLWEEYMRKNPLESIRNIVKAYKENPELLNKDAFKVSIVGTVELRKGQLEGVKAVKDLNQNGINAHLLIVGLVAEQEYYEEIKLFVEEHDLQDKIHYIGGLKPPFTVVRDSDVYLMASTFEAFGRVTAEAMLLRKPIVGASNGGTPELVSHEETGFLYESGDIPQLVDYLIRLANDEGLRLKMGEKGYERINEIAGLDILGGGVLKVLENAVAYGQFGSVSGSLVGSWIKTEVLDKSIVGLSTSLLKYKLRGMGIYRYYNFFKGLTKRVKRKLLK